MDSARAGSGMLAGAGIGALAGAALCPGDMVLSDLGAAVVITAGGAAGALAALGAGACLRRLSGGTWALRGPDAATPSEPRTGARAGGWVRWPRWRLRTALAAVAYVAVLLGVVRGRQDRESAAQQARFHALLEADALRLASSLEENAAGWERAAAAPVGADLPKEERGASAADRAARLRQDVVSLRDQAASHARARRGYQRSASRPWLSLTPASPGPK